MIPCPSWFPDHADPLPDETDDPDPRAMIQILLCRIQRLQRRLSEVTYAMECLSLRHQAGLIATDLAAGEKRILIRCFVDLQVTIRHDREELGRLLGELVRGK